MTESIHSDAPDSAPMTGAEFRALRESLGLDGQAVAARLGVAERTVRRWEQGSQQPPAGIRDDLWRMIKEDEQLARELVDQAHAGAGLLMIPFDGDQRGSAMWWRMIAARCLHIDPSLRVEYLMWSGQ